MKIFMVILTLLCFTFHTLAATETILLVSPLVQIEERDLPIGLDQEYKSFSQYYLENNPKERNVDNLLNEFENAQKYYLVNSKELARQYYEKVVAYSDVDEWKDVHRKIIFLSYIRLSELNPQESDDWIAQALKFSLETDPRKLNLSKDTVRNILKLKESFSKKSIEWQVSQFKRDFKYILINGHVIDLKKIEIVKIPSGKFRITFLSDIYKLQTYQVTSQQIPLLTPTRIPFVSGSCARPFVNNEGEIHSQIAVYYSNECLKTLNGTKWIAKRDSKVTDHFDLPKPYDFTSRVEYNTEPFYKKKWFLVAMGILGATAAIYAINESKKEKPTHETVNGF